MKYCPFAQRAHLVLAAKKIKYVGSIVLVVAVLICLVKSLIPVQEREGNLSSKVDRLLGSVSG